MPFIEPFRGVRYSRSEERFLSRVITPPYDVISPEGQRCYYRSHPFNFVRVVFGMESSKDDDRNNRYVRAGRTLRRWMEKGVLRADPEPSLYPYVQEYRMLGRRIRRWGVVALVRLDSPRIYPHEETREGPKEDRLRLLEAVRASLSPIFGLIPDESGSFRRWIGRAARGRPVAQAGLEGVRHRLWRVSDPRRIRALQALLRKRELVIADGHHRFEAAKAFWLKRRRRGGGAAPERFAMFFLASVSKEEPGLLPTHRVLRNVPPGKLQRFHEMLLRNGKGRRTGTLREAESFLLELRRRGRMGIGFYAGNGEGMVLEGQARTPGRLDVEWLHEELLPRWFGEGLEIRYTQDAREGAGWVRRGRAGALFLMQPPRLREVVHRARRNQRLPGKTTYFYPKPVAGLVEYLFEPR